MSLENSPCAGAAFLSAGPPPPPLSGVQSLPTVGHGCHAGVFQGGQGGRGSVHTDFPHERALCWAGLATAELAARQLIQVNTAHPGTQGTGRASVFSSSLWISRAAVTKTQTSLCQE